MQHDENAPCPCGFGSPYGRCCGRLHAGTPAPTALDLMRSRYSAFACGLTQYLIDTWHPSTRPPRLELDPHASYLRLIIDAHDGGGPFDAAGTVTFTAVGRDASGRFEQHETSRFVREHRVWYYLDGDAAAS